MALARRGDHLTIDELDDAAAAFLRGDRDRWAGASLVLPGWFDPALPPRVTLRTVFVSVTLGGRLAATVTVSVSLLFPVWALASPPPLTDAEFVNVPAPLVTVSCTSG